MPFVKSLFCLKGADNLARFAAIVLLSNVVFTLLSATFISIPVLAFIIAIPCFVVIALTTLRRLNDAQTNAKWPLLNSVLFLLAALTIVIFQQTNIYWLLVPNVLVSLYLLSLKSTGQKSYQLGYNGPVELQATTQASTSRGTRIEPTLAASNLAANNNVSFSEQAENTAYSAEQHKEQQATNTGHHAEGNPLLELVNQYKIHLTVGFVVFFTAIFGIKALLNSKTTEAHETPEILEQVAQQQLRLHELEMPDDFLLSLSETDGLFIEWQISNDDPVSLWSIETAQGDKSCKEITFNNGDSVRSISVAIENDTLQYAHFSPLDTEFIVRSLAKRGSFNLCGYKFSLKGSQAAIGKHAKYSDYMTYSG